MRAVTQWLVLASAGALFLSSCAAENPVPRFRGVSQDAEGPPALSTGASAASDPAPSTEAPLLEESELASTGAGVDPTLATVGGRVIRTSDLLQNLLYREGDVLRLELNLMIGSALAKLEAERMGLQLDMELVDARAAEHLGEFVRRNVPDGVELDEFVTERLGVAPAAFQSRLRSDTVRELVTERMVRAHTLANEHVRLRLLAAERDAAEAAAQRHAAGEPFEALVRELSRDRSAEDGGLLPFVGRSERSPISQLAFRTPVGELGGPIQVGGLDVLVLVEDRPAPVTGDWRAVRERVEASLADEPVREEEFVFWQVAMELRYTVDLAPLAELVPGLAP